MDSHFGDKVKVEEGEAVSEDCELIRVNGSLQSISYLVLQEDELLSCDFSLFFSVGFTVVEVLEDLRMLFDQGEGLLSFLVVGTIHNPFQLLGLYGR